MCLPSISYCCGFSTLRTSQVLFANFRDKKVSVSNYQLYTFFKYNFVLIHIIKLFTHLYIFKCQQQLGTKLTEIFFSRWNFFFKLNFFLNFTTNAGHLSQSFIIFLTIKKSCILFCSVPGVGSVIWFQVPGFTARACKQHSQVPQIRNQDFRGSGDILFLPPFHQHYRPMIPPTVILRPQGQLSKIKKFS